MKTCINKHYSDRFMVGVMGSSVLFNRLTDVVSSLVQDALLKGAARSVRTPSRFSRAACVC